MIRQTKIMIIIIILRTSMIIETCIQKEMKLKYELENNVNLVLFTNNRIEISFNPNLNKNFVKDYQKNYISGPQSDGLFHFLMKEEV